MCVRFGSEDSAITQPQRGGKGEWGGKYGLLFFFKMCLWCAKIRFGSFVFWPSLASFLCKLSRYLSLLGTRATERKPRKAREARGRRPPCARWPCCAHSAAPARRSSAGWEGSTKPGGHARRLCDVNTCFGLDAAAHSPPVAKDEGQQPGAKGHALGASSSSASAEEAASACCTIHDCGRAGGDCFGHAQAG